MFITKAVSPAPATLEEVFVFDGSASFNPDRLLRDRTGNLYLFHGRPEDNTTTQPKPVTAREALNWYVEGSKVSDSSRGDISPVVESALDGWSNTTAPDLERVPDGFRLIEGYVRNGFRTAVGYNHGGLAIIKNERIEPATLEKVIEWMSETPRFAHELQLEILSPIDENAVADLFKTIGQRLKLHAV